MNNNVSLFPVLLATLFAVVMIVGSWKMFEKAGEAGWKVLIPLYNTYLYFKIAGRNGWGFLLMLIPFVNIVVSLVIAMDLAKHFGKSSVYGVVALWLLPFIGTLDLGFGSASYVGTKHA